MASEMSKGERTSVAVHLCAMEVIGREEVDEPVVAVPPRHMSFAKFVWLLRCSPPREIARILFKSKEWL